MATSKKAIVAVYAREYQHLQNRTLARLIFEKEPGLFANIEVCRSTVRVVRGNCGEDDRHRAEFPRPNGYAGDVLSIPQAEEPIDITPYDLGIVGRIGIISDLHFPVHDVRAIETALDYIESQDVKAIIINGDLIDFHELSRFDQIPGSPSTKEEISRVIPFLHYLRERFADQEIIFKLGNHDKRLETYFARQAKALAEIEAFKLRSLLRLSDFGIIEVEDKRAIKLGKLTVLHGHERYARFGGGVNPARTLLLWAHSSILVGHSHKTDQYSDLALDRSEIACWITGALCAKAPNYDPWAKWNHGFAVVEVDETGMFAVDNLRIMDGVVR